MKRFWLVLTMLFLGGIVFSYAGEVEAMKKAVLVIAHEGFRDEELLDTKEALEKNGIEVKVASTELSEAKGKLGARVMPDRLFKDINMQDFDALVFVGGPGAVQYWDDPLAHKLLKEAAVSGKVVAGICSAAATLARAGILKGKRATVFPGDSQELIANGANYTARHVEKDGQIITADGPSAARGFGEEIARALKK
ncbi:MAG: DJ-1/PfpI family protein [Candidatus Omnitrophica bacterium]|nr:DJ-1/PfpI family protein [Candidatus Omnitrophota bacterium]